MSRIAQLVFLLSTRYFAVFAQDGFICDDPLTTATTCLIKKNLDYTEDYTAVDDVACTDCFTKNSFFENVAAYDTCNGATSDICSYFTTCHDVCYPNVNVCQQELYDYYVCLFGAALAPENCIVQCEGSSGNGNGSDALDTSGVLVPASIAASSSIFLLAVAGLLL